MRKENGNKRINTHNNPFPVTWHRNRWCRQRSLPAGAWGAMGENQWLPHLSPIRSMGELDFLQIQNEISKFIIWLMVTCFSEATLAREKTTSTSPGLSTWWET